MVPNANVYNFSANIEDEGGLPVTSGLLHFPPQKRDIYVADCKAALRKWKSSVYGHKSRKGRKGDPLNVQFSRDSCSAMCI